MSSKSRSAASIFLGLIFAGTPTAIEFDGTSEITTAFAPDGDIVANRDWAKYLGARPNVAAIAYDRRTAEQTVAKSDGDAVAKDYIVAEHRVSADDDVEGMFDDQPAAHHGLAWQLHMA